MFKINYLTLFYFGLDGWEFNFKVGGGSPLPGLWLTRPDLLAVAHALHISALVPILAAIPYNRVNIVTQYYHISLSSILHCRPLKLLTMSPHRLCVTILINSRRGTLR